LRGSHGCQLTLLSTAWVRERAGVQQHGCGNTQACARSLGSDRLPTRGRSTAGCSCRSLRGTSCPGRTTRTQQPPPLLLAAARARPRPARSPAPRSASCAPFVLCATRPVATRRFLPLVLLPLGALPGSNAHLSAFPPAAPVWSEEMGGVGVLGSRTRDRAPGCVRAFFWAPRCCRRPSSGKAPGASSARRWPQLLATT
jgi:hypothetical protein